MDNSMDYDAKRVTEAQVPTCVAGVPVTEMEERVARALAIRQSIDPDKLGPGTRHVLKIDGIDHIMATHSGPLWIIWVPEARVAIRAMREPTRVMRDKGAAEFYGFDPEWDSLSEYITDAWQAMIDAASPAK